MDVYSILKDDEENIKSE